MQKRYKPSGGFILNVISETNINNIVYACDGSTIKSCYSSTSKK